MIAILFQLNWQFAETRIGDEHISHVFWCVGIILATLLLKRPLSVLISKLIAIITNRFSDRKHGKLFQELTVKPVELLLQVMLYYIAINQLTALLNYVIFRRLHSNKMLEVRISDVVDRIFLLLLISFFILVISRIVDFIFHILVERANENENREKEQLLPLLKEVVKLILWTMGLFWILGSVFDVNIPALITGLGIGGVAIALAAKESVENFFAAFTILTDRPFSTGDVVKLGTLEGAVERIGFRSTRLRNADGALFIIPNKKLIGENLENQTMRDRRRVRTVFNLKYGIDPGELQRLIAELHTATATGAHVIEPIAVAMEGFGENTFQLVISYHLSHPLAEGAKLDLIKHDVNLKAYSVISKYTLTPPAPEPENPCDDDEPEEEKKDETGLGL